MKFTLKTPTGEVVAFNPSEIVVEGGEGDKPAPLTITHAGAYTVEISGLTMRTISTADAGFVIGDYVPAWNTAPTVRHLADM